MISIISNVYQNSLSFKGLQAAAQTTPANIEKLAEEKQKKATILSILYNSIIGKNADASGNKALDTTITKSFYNAALASGADIVKKQMAILLTCFDSNNGSNDVPKKENLARFALFYSLFEKFDATTPKVIEEIPKNYSGVDAVKADLVSLILLCFDFSGTSGDLVKKIEKELLKKDSGFLVKTLYDIFSKNPNAELSAIVGLEANDVLTKKTIYNFFTIGIADIASVDLGNGPTKHSVEIKNIELTALRKAVVPFFLKPEWHKDFNSLTADDIKTEIDTLTTIDLVSFYHAQQTTEGLTLGDFVAKIVDLNTIIDDGGTTIENGIKTALQVIFDNANTKITINSQQIGVLSGAPADLLAAKQASLYEYLNSFATVMASARETILGVKTDVPGVVMSDFIQSITSWNQQTGLSVDNQINSLEDLFKNATVQNAQDANGLKNHHIENNRTILGQLLKHSSAVSALDDCKKNRFFVGDGAADQDQDNIDASEKFMFGLKYQIVVQYLKTNGLILDTADDTAVFKYLQDTSNDMLTDLQRFCNNEDSNTTFFNAGSAPIEPKQIFDKFKELKEEKDQIEKYWNLYNDFYKKCDNINKEITTNITGQSGLPTSTLAKTTGVDFQAALKDKDAAARATEFQTIVNNNVKQLWEYYDGVKQALNTAKNSINIADPTDKLTYLDILAKSTKYSDQITIDVQTLALSKPPATIAVSPTITTNVSKFTQDQKQQFEILKALSFLPNDRARTQTNLHNFYTAALGVPSNDDLAQILITCFDSKASGATKAQSENLASLQLTYAWFNAISKKTALNYTTIDSTPDIKKNLANLIIFFFDWASIDKADIETIYQNLSKQSGEFLVQALYDLFSGQELHCNLKNIIGDRANSKYNQSLVHIFYNYKDINHTVLGHNSKSVADYKVKIEQANMKTLRNAVMPFFLDYKLNHDLNKIFSSESEIQTAMQALAKIDLPVLQNLLNTTTRPLSDVLTQINEFYDQAGSGAFDNGSGGNIQKQLNALDPTKVDIGNTTKQKLNVVVGNATKVEQNTLIEESLGEYLTILASPFESGITNPLGDNANIAAFTNVELTALIKSITEWNAQKGLSNDNKIKSLSDLLDKKGTAQTFNGVTGSEVPAVSQAPLMNQLRQKYDPAVENTTNAKNYLFGADHGTVEHTNQMQLLSFGLRYEYVVLTLKNAGLVKDSDGVEEIKTYLTDTGLIDDVISFCNKKQATTDMFVAKTQPISISNITKAITKISNAKKEMDNLVEQYAKLKTYFLETVRKFQKIEKTALSSGDKIQLTSITPPKDLTAFQGELAIELTNAIKTLTHDKAIDLTDLKKLFDDGVTDLQTRLVDLYNAAAQEVNDANLNTAGKTITILAKAPEYADILVDLDKKELLVNDFETQKNNFFKALNTKKVEITKDAEKIKSTMDTIITIYALNDKFSAKKAEQKAIYNLLLANDYMTNPTNINNFFKTYIIKNNDSNEERLTFNESMGLLSFSIKDANNITIDLEKFKAIDQAFQDTTRKIESGEGAVRGSQGDKYTYSPKELLISILIHFVDDSSTIGLGADKASSQLIAFNFLNAMDSDKILDIYDQIYKNYYNDVNNTELFQNTVLKDFAMVADLDKTIINIAAGNDNGGAAHEFDYITKDNAIGTQHLKVMPDHFNKVFVDYIYPYMVKQAVTQNKTMMKDFTGENINKIPINYLSSGDISSEITQMEELKTMRLVDFAAFVNGLTETTARGELLQKIENIKKEIPEKADFAKNDYLAEEIDSFISFLEPDKKTEFIEQKDVIDGLTLTKIDSTDFGAITTADALTKAIETINKGLDAPDQIKSLFDLCKKTTTNNMITCNVGSTTIASTTKQTNLAHLNAVLGTTELTLEHVGWFLFKQELQIEGLIKQDADNDDIKNLINDIGDANLRKDIKTLLTTDIVNNKPNFTSQLTVDYKGTKLDLTQISWNPLISALRFHIPTIAEKEKIIEEYVNDYTKALAKLKELHNIPELKILENAPIWGATTTAGDFEVSLQALMYNKDFNTVVSTTAKTENDKLVGTYAIGDYQAVLASFKLTEQSKKDAFNLSKQTFASLLVEQNKYAEKIKEYIETGWENLFHPDRLNITEEAKKKKFHDLVDDFADTNKIAGAFDLLFTQLGMTDELTTLKTFLGTDGKKVAILKGFLQGAFKDGGSADIGYADQDAIMNTILATKFKYDNLSEEALSVYLQNAILEKQKTQIKNTSVFGDVKINSLNVNYQAFTELFAARKTLNDTKNVVNLADFINKLNEAIKTNHYTNGDNFTQFKDLFQKICTIGEKMNTEITSSGDAFVATVLDPTTIGDFNGVFREETLEAYLEDGLAAPTITNITQTKSALGSLQEAEIKNKIEAKIEPIVTFFGTEAKLETIQKKLNGKIKDQFLAVADVKNIFDVGQSYTTFQTEIAPLINNVDDTHLNKALEIMQTDLQQALEGCFNKTEASILTTELVEGYNQTAGGGTITVARQEAIKSTPAKLTKLSGLNFNPQFQAVAKILDVKDTTAGSIAYYEDLFSKIETIKTSITNLKNNDTIKAIGINQKVFTFNDATLDVAIVNANTVNSLSIDELVSKLELKNTGISQKIQDLKTASDSFINKLIGSETAQQNTALQQQINQLKGEKQILEDQKSHLSTGKNTLQQELNDKIAAYDALARENNVLESVRKKFVEEVFGSANDNADYKALSQGLKDALVDNVKNLLLAKYEAEKTKYETEKSLRETAENKKAQAESDKNNTVSEHNKTKEKLKKLTESATELSTFMGLSNPPEDRAAAQTTIKQEKQKMDKIIPNKANFSEFITDLTTLNGQLEQQTKKGTLDANIKAALTKMDDSAVVKQNQELEKEKQDLQVIIGDKDTKIADLETKVKTAEDAKTAAENNNSGSETDSKKKFTTKEVIVAGMVLTVCASVGGKFAGDAILNTTSSNKKGHKKSNSENLTNPKKIEDTNPKNEDI